MFARFAVSDRLSDQAKLREDNGDPKRTFFNAVNGKPNHATLNVDDDILELPRNCDGIGIPMCKEFEIMSEASNRG